MASSEQQAPWMCPFKADKAPGSVMMGEILSCAMQMVAMQAINDRMNLFTIELEGCLSVLRDVDKIAVNDFEKFDTNLRRLRLRVLLAPFTDMTDAEEAWI